MSETDHNPVHNLSIWRKVPGFARAILIAQFAIIVYLATWIYLEYQNNRYLQVYLNTSLQSNIPVLQTAIPIFLATGTITVYAKLLKGGKKQDEWQSTENEFTPLKVPAPTLLYPDEVTAPSLTKQPISQLKAILASKRTTSRTVIRGRQTGRTISRRRPRKRSRSPTEAES